MQNKTESQLQKELLVEQLRKLNYKVCKAKTAKKSKEKVLAELDSLLNELGI